MILAICLPAALLGWLLCARLDYRIAVRREWLASVTYRGDAVSCPDYFRARHSADRCCRKCATSAKEDFGASRRHRVLLALTGPLLLLAILPWLLITSGQPLPASEREHRLKQAEEELARVTDWLNRLAGPGEPDA